MKKIKTVLSVLAVLLAFLAVFCLVTRLLTPKYATELVEGSMISQYYDEAGGHDVIFIGDCEVYSNFSPMEIGIDLAVADEDHIVTARSIPISLPWKCIGSRESPPMFEGLPSS